MLYCSSSYENSVSGCSMWACTCVVCTRALSGLLAPSIVLCWMRWQLVAGVHVQVYVCVCMGGCVGVFAMMDPLQDRTAFSTPSRTLTYILTTPSTRCICCDWAKRCKPPANHPFLLHAMWEWSNCVCVRVWANVGQLMRVGSGWWLRQYSSIRRGKENNVKSSSASQMH